MADDKISRTNIPIDDPDQISSLWYVMPSASRKDGWLVFSSDFILQTLRGFGDVFWPMSKEPILQLLVLVASGGMAILQALVMLLSKLPIISWFMGMIAQYFGRNIAGFFLRSSYWKAKLRKLGQNTLIDQGVDMWGPERIEIGGCCIIGANTRLSAGRGEGIVKGSIIIGHYVDIGRSCFLGGSGQIIIGDYVGLGDNVGFYSSTNVMFDLKRPGQLISMSHRAPSDRYVVVSGKIEVQDYAFVGFASTILPRVTLGRGAIVHPYSEVSHSFPAFANIAGPGKAIQKGWRKPPRLDPRLTRLSQDSKDFRGR